MIFRSVGAAVLLALVSVTPLARAGILEDRGIEDAIERSYVFRELLIDRSMVQCYVRYGIVELRGQVADERERDLLTYFISALPEVKQIDNRLFVDSDTRRGGARWQVLRLRSQLLMLSAVDARQTRVAVVGERWHLVGEFNDEATRLDFTKCAQGLAPDVPLSLSLSSGSGAPKPPAAMDDASIAAIVRSALEFSPAISLHDPVISCFQGKVTLRGFVRTTAEQDMAAQLAAVSRGVNAVDNRLSLQP